ncbi:MAG TPA: hypothetical protein VFS37_09000 [Conexibacter sp.]|nr:hypothetical protein [Conexibacter sp.]
MSLHHPPLLSFEEALGAGARLHLRQQDALRHAAETAGLQLEVVAKAIDAYLRRMSETEIRRPRRPAGPVVPLGQTTVHEHLPAGDDRDDDGGESRAA